MPISKSNYFFSYILKGIKAKHFLLKNKRLMTLLNRVVGAYWVWVCWASIQIIVVNLHLLNKSNVFDLRRIFNRLRNNEISKCACIFGDGKSRTERVCTLSCFGLRLKVNPLMENSNVPLQMSSVLSSMDCLVEI